MENNWYGQFSFDEVETLRQKAEKDLSIRYDIANLTGNDVELSELIVNGPDEGMIATLKEAPEGDPIYQDFDNVWGTGAAEHYSTLEEPHGLWEHLTEIPGAAARGGAGALAEGYEAYSNLVARPVGNFLFGSKAEQAELQVGRMQDRVDRLTEQGADPAVIADAQNQLGIATTEAEKVRGFDETKLADYNATEVEFDANTILRGMIEKPETATGVFTEGAVQFALPFFAGYGGVTKLAVMAESGRKGSIAAGLITGFVTDAFAFDEDEPLATSAIADYFGIESEIVDDYFRHSEDDPDIEKRFRRAVEGAGIGLALDGVMVGVARVFRDVKAKRVAPEDATEEIKKILEQVETEDLTKALRETKKPDPMTPQKQLWMFDTERAAHENFSGVKPADAPAKVADDIAAEAKQSGTKIETIEPRFEEVAENLTGQKYKPVVTAKEHDLAIARATRIWDAARQVVERQDAWTIAKGYLKDATDTLAEHGIRTKEQISRAVIRPFQEAVRLIDAGDIKGLREWADADSLSIIDFRMRSAAVQLATRSVRGQTERMASMVDAALNSGKLTPHEEAVIRDMFHKQVQLSMEVEALNANLGSAAGALLGQRAAHMNVYEELMAARKVAVEEAEAQKLNPRQAKKYVRAAAKEAEKRVLKKLRTESGTGNAAFMSQRYRELVDHGVDPVVAFKRVTEMRRQADRAGTVLNPTKNKEVNAAKAAVNEETRIDKFLRGLEQWRYNAMLSGIKTHETNFLSSFAQMTSRLAYEAAWGTVTGDKAMVKASAQKLVGITTGMKDSLTYALEAYKQMKPLLDDVSQLERFEPVYRNHLLTFPTRLMLGTDQFIKHMAYRGEVRASASLDADLMKLKGKNRDAFIRNRMDKAFDPKTGAGTDMLAISRAQEVTFQKQFDPNSKYLGERLMAKGAAWTSKTLAGRFLFPFMRIWFRLTDEGLRMTPVVRESIAIGAKIGRAINGQPGSSKYFDDLMGMNGKPAQARAAGEYMMGLSLVGWTMAMVAEGKITGGEERNYVDAAMRRKVIPPYSIKVGNEWYSYERFEPFAFPMKLFANQMIRLRKLEAAEDRGEFERESEKVQALIGTIAYGFGESFTNNSFMEGVESLAKMTSGSFEGDGVWQRPAHTFIDSFVPNIIRKANQSFDDTGFKYKANPLTVDSFARHVSSLLDMSDVDLERNQFTGEPYTYTDDHDLAGHHLFVGTFEINDKAMELLIEANENTGRQFVLKRPGAFFRNEDLRSYEAEPGGRSLYDLYQQKFSEVEINGVTYRQALEKLADDPTFKAMPWGNKTRVAGTKAEAISELKSEFEKATTVWLEANSKPYAYLAGKQALFERQQGDREVTAARKQRAQATLGLSQ